MIAALVEAARVVAAERLAEFTQRVAKVEPASGTSVEAAVCAPSAIDANLERLSGLGIIEALEGLVRIEPATSPECYNLGPPEPTSSAPTRPPATTPRPWPASWRRRGTWRSEAAGAQIGTGPQAPSASPRSLGSRGGPRFALELRPSGYSASQRPGRDRVTEKVARFLARHADDFAYGFISYQPRDRAVPRAADLAAAYDDVLGRMRGPRALHHTVLDLGAASSTGATPSSTSPTSSSRATSSPGSTRTSACGRWAAGRCPTRCRRS